MGIETIALAATVIGTAAGVYGQVQANKANKRRERLEKSRLNAEKNRANRRAWRDRVRNQAMNEAAVGASGAGFGGSIAVAGAQGPASTANISASDTGVNYQIGQGFMAADRQLAQGQMVSGVGGSLASLGGTIFNNSTQINRVLGLTKPATPS